MLEFELGGEEEELLESLELLCCLECGSFSTGKVVDEPFLDGALVGLAISKLADEPFLDGSLVGLAISKLADEPFLDGTLIEGLATSKLADETFLLIAEF